MGGSGLTAVVVTVSGLELSTPGLAERPSASAWAVSCDPILCDAAPQCWLGDPRGQTHADGSGPGIGEEAHRRLLTTVAPGQTVGGEQHVGEVARDVDGGVRAVGVHQAVRFAKGEGIEGQSSDDTACEPTRPLTTSAPMSTRRPSTVSP